MAKEFYQIELAGLKRDLPIVEIGNMEIASFVMLGDTELNFRVAQEMIKIFPSSDFDYLVVPEAKAIPLAQSICQLYFNGHFKDYIVLRKSIKSYMQDPLVTRVKSITTSGKQDLVMAREDANKIKDKIIYLLDDVVSTGSSYSGMIDLVKMAGGKINFAGAVLREGNFDLSEIEKKLGFEISFLGNLPIFSR